jgi:V8-like Glu-specific endopeptidase
MEKNICKIFVEKDQGTGFFCKIPLIGDNASLHVLISNNHIINRESLYKKDSKISLYIEEKMKIKIIDLNNRIKYTNENYDISIIEIKESDEIQNYLEIDDIIMKEIIDNKNRNDKYIDKTIYTIQYPEGELSVSYGVLSTIFLDKEYNFLHKCNTKKGSSGSPVLNMNNKVIGIHKEGIDGQYNIGAFLIIRKLLTQI